MEYTLSDKKLQELNVMIDQGGHIPSAVSEALKDAQIAAAGGNASALNTALNRAIAANIAEGAAWSRVQGWHDSVKESGSPPVDPPIPSQPPTSGLSVPDPFPADKVRRYWGPVAAGVDQVTHAAGPGTFEFSVGSGSNRYQAWLNGKLVVDSPTAYVNGVQAGDEIKFRFLDGPPNTCNGSLG